MSVNWEAKWIWSAGNRKTPNYFFYARKNFELADACQSAELHITAYTDYILYINGRYIGRGPSPSNAKTITYDTYDTYDIGTYLSKGNNVIAVLAHNYAVGVHWNPVAPGGLIVQGQIATKNQSFTLTSDASWKVKTAECYAPNSPRMMFSCRFLETFFMDRYDPLWNTADFDDHSWEPAQEIGAHPVFPYQTLLPKPIPFIREELLQPVAMEKGKYTIAGFHAVSFSEIQKRPAYSLIYATTYFHSPVKQEVHLLLSCDDAFVAFVNGQRVLRQEYDEQYVKSVMWYGREDYEQFHLGGGPRNELALIQLEEGWNKVTVVVDNGPHGWGFALGLTADMDPAHNDGRFNTFLDLPFTDGSSDAPSPEDLPPGHMMDINWRQPKFGHWRLEGPFQTTFIKNSLDEIDDDHPPQGGKCISFKPSIHKTVTDYQLLMRGETRSGFETADPRTPVTLKEGDCLIYDIGKMEVGYIELDLTVTEKTVLDVFIGNVLSDEKKICGMGDMRAVDRLYLTPGKLHWQAISRRDGRYIHLCCRKGKQLRLESVSLLKVGYPVESKDRFECSDPILNAVFEASKHSTSLIMQHNYEDCLRREEGVHNGRNAIHAFMASYYAFGDGRLIRKMFLDLLYTQDDRGWISGAGPIDNSCDEITKAMWGVEYLKRYYDFSGDVGFIKQVYERVRCFMNYLSRLENKQILIDGKNEFNNIRGRSLWIDDLTHSPRNRVDLDMQHLSYNALYYGTLNNMAVLAEAAGERRDAFIYQKKASYLKDSFNRVFWDESAQMYTEWVKDEENAGEVQDAFLIMALYYGVCDPEKERKVLDRLFDPVTGTLRKYEDYRFTFGFYYFIFEVMLKHGMEKSVHDLLRVYFGAWLELGFTAFGEFFILPEFNQGKSLGREFNVHLDSTAAHVFYYSHILGIRPLQPGFQKTVIAPLPGDLTRASGSVFTPLGNVDVTWQVDGERFDLEAVIPADMICQIVIPPGLTAGKIVKKTRENAG